MRRVTAVKVTDREWKEGRPIDHTAWSLSDREGPLWQGLFTSLDAAKRHARRCGWVPVRHGVEVGRLAPGRLSGEDG
jgi:hypothetical protein